MSEHDTKRFPPIKIGGSVYVPVIALAIFAAGVGELQQSLGAALAVMGFGLLVAAAFTRE